MKAHQPDQDDPARDRGEQVRVGDRRTCHPLDAGNDRQQDFRTVTEHENHCRLQKHGKYERRYLNGNVIALQGPHDELEFQQSHRTTEHAGE